MTKVDFKISSMNKKERMTKVDFKISSMNKKERMTEYYHVSQLLITNPQITIDNLPITKNASLVPHNSYNISVHIIL